MEKQSQSQSPLSARRAYDEIVTRLPGTSWEFASTLSKKGHKGLHKDIKVTGGLSYNLALLTNKLFGITTLNVITRYCIDHRGYFRWFLQQNLSIEVKWRDGTFWLQFINITRGNWVKLSLRGFRFLFGFFLKKFKANTFSVVIGPWLSESQFGSQMTNPSDFGDCLGKPHWHVQ